MYKHAYNLKEAWSSRIVKQETETNISNSALVNYIQIVTQEKLVNFM